MDQKYYLNLRNRFRPKKTRTVFVLESPPASGKYFYDTTGFVSEPLFAAMMELLSIEPGTKQEGLEYFSNMGHFLVDASYEPVNKLKEKAREKTILDNYKNLVQDLNSLGNPNTINYVLIKANICRLLEPRLKAQGFNVVNNGIVVPFPSTGQQNNFREEIAKVFISEAKNA